MDNYSEQDFITDLINEREQSMDEWELGVVAEYNCEKECMEKKEDVECCSCLETLTCVKLPNCDHFICPKCHHKIYRGFISDDFYTSYKRPCFGSEKPEYPYKDINENTEIYAKLLLSGDRNICEDWFINANEDLYKTCVNQETGFIDECVKEQTYKTLINIKEWFETDEKIKKYEEDIVKFYMEYKIFEEKNDLYERLREENKKHNCVKKCPLCRQ